MTSDSGTVSAEGAAAVALGGCIALAAAMGIGRFVYTPILPFMVESLGLSQAQAGIVASANFLGYLLGALAAAKAALPGGRRRWFLAALAVSALTTAAMAAETALILFLVLRFAGGVASAFVLVFSSALVLDRLAAAGKPGFSALHFAGVGCGIAVSAVLVAWMAAQGSDWRGLWLASGAVSLLALAAAVRLIPPEPEGTSSPPRGAAQDGDRRRLVALIVAYGLFGFGYVITATFISTLVRLTPEIRWLEPYVWLTVGLAAVPSVAFWTWVAGRLGKARGFALACLAEGLGVALSVLGSGALSVLLAAALLGGTFMGITALGLVYARSLTAGDPRRSIALMTAAFGLGQMIGPSFAGYAYGFGQSFLLPSLVAAAALLIAFALTMDWRRAG
ncbi:YbfB/YjiJ family MFS transporter [Pelagibius sp.]|uniref:YbfB/YjiJ family MFS transporter n=1 Tax=Pelagibius sp. TaxID=1931238 RepID=UPI003B500013